MKNIKILVMLLIFIFATFKSNSCTVAVISGKYTKDGRPLLWKNRDTWAVHNRIVYFTDGKYHYTGLVNSGDKKGKSVWIGMNEKGFAIMNSASYNMNLKDTTELSGLEGRIIKQALATCATVEDFEKYLDGLKKPTGLEGNFGVIDAQGNAVMYEVSNHGYVKFDANDPTVAPFGYVLRANYSFSGTYGKESSGYIRYNTVNKLFYDASATNSFDAQFILQDVTRGLKNSLVKTDLYDQYGNIPQNTPTYAFFHDFIPRRSSASSCVVQGVKKGESVDNIMMWSAVGFPLTSVVIPVWMKAGNDFPQVLKLDEKLKDSPVCYAALTLKKQLFPIRWGKFASKFYIQINALVNADNTGIRQKIIPFENEIFAKSENLVDEMQKSKFSKSKVEAHNKWINSYVKELYKTQFNINL